MADAQPVPQGVDTGVPSPARIYDYLLAGDNNFAADRAAAEQIMKAVPEIRDAAWSNRGFHQRAAKWIAQQGIRQFVDIGSGLPTVGNTHEVVRARLAGDPRRLRGQRPAGAGAQHGRCWPVTGQPACCSVTSAIRTGSWDIPSCGG